MRVLNAMPFPAIVHSSVSLKHVDGIEPASQPSILFQISGHAASVLGTKPKHGYSMMPNVFRCASPDRN